MKARQISLLRKEVRYECRQTQYDDHPPDSPNRLLSEHALRKMLKDGKLPAIFIGKKALVNYDKLVEQLQSLNVKVSEMPEEK